MKHKIVTYALLPTVLGLGLLGANMVSAHGFFGFGTNRTPEEIATHQQEMFQREATLLGVSVDVMKNGWAQGKTLQQIATDNGITADQLKTKMQEARAAEMKTQLQALVTKGVITQAQADQRLQFMQSVKTKGPKMGHGFHRGGF